MMIIQLTTEELQTIINESVKQALQEHEESQNKISSNSEEKDLLNVKETAKFLDLTIPTIYSKVNRGELPYMKKAKRLYFSKKELTDFLKGGRKKSIKELQAEVDKYFTKKKD